MTIEKNVSGNTAEISIGGWLDTKTAAELAKAAELLVLNMKELEYTSSAGIRMIVAAYKKMKSFRIKNVSGDIMEVLRMTGFDKRLNIV